MFLLCTLFNDALGAIVLPEINLFLLIPLTDFLSTF